MYDNLLCRMVLKSALKSAWHPKMYDNLLCRMLVLKGAWHFRSALMVERLGFVL